jgi:dihydrofolate reductase
MNKLSSFTFLTLNGFYKGPGEDISWHRHGEEESTFAAEGAGSDSILVFGRVTYQMMAGYWPTPMALQQNPAVARGMNQSEKIVFSRTLQKAEWANTRVVTANLAEEIRRLKTEGGKDLTILGSGSIVTQLAAEGLIDAYQVMINPVALGRGTTLFAGLEGKLDLQLTGSRVFKSGVVLLNYKPV